MILLKQPDKARSQLHFFADLYESEELIWRYPVRTHSNSIVYISTAPRSWWKCTHHTNGSRLTSMDFERIWCTEKARKVVNLNFGVRCWFGTSSQCNSPRNWYSFTICSVLHGRRRPERPQHTHFNEHCRLCYSRLITHVLKDIISTIADTQTDSYKSQTLAGPMTSQSKVIYAGKQPNELTRDVKNFHWTKMDSSYGAHW